MGHNISGIAINKNFENNVEELSKLLGVELQIENEIIFEDASENWKEEGYFDVYFSKNGTLVFANIDYCLEPYSHKETNILTFALSETSMTFNIGYTENDVLVRSIMKVNDEIVDEEGEPLQCEIDNEDDMTETIFDQIGEVIGTHFYEIELDEKAYRFTLKNAASVEQPKQVQVEVEPVNSKIEPEVTKEVSQQLFNAKTNSPETANKGVGIELIGVAIVIIVMLIALIYVIVSVINLP
ncbi:hypothetical protein NAT47_09060 [Flavobacterium sp. HXWNR69]|uniref:Uncharacterized protein n=1 Tax=Flavobacterium fragile TaxID=2949085 RepID=A0ABT0TI87_9FLAO|nr:hypothetical protein [Flavobacterium sp. HXWNR69]MCL9770567.1 hypothetical protein [Flavobacterium sp. HXWNR69]